MDKRRHLSPPPSYGNFAVFCILVVTAKRSVDEVFMHYFHNLASASGGFASNPRRGSIPGPRWGTLIPRSLICPPLEKILRAPMLMTVRRVHLPLGHTLNNILCCCCCCCCEPIPETEPARWSFRLRNSTTLFISCTPRLLT